MGYGQSGDVSKGISWILNLMNKYSSQPHLKGYYDHHCLGILYYTNNQYDLAQVEFEKQLLNDADFADTYYYLVLMKKQKSKHVLAKKIFKQALEKMSSLNGGNSINLFIEYNTSKEDVEEMLCV